MIEGQANIGVGDLNEGMFMKSNEVFGAVKIKDGLFMGDQYSSQDLEFLAVNKISHIVNCAGHHLRNKWT